MVRDNGELVEDEGVGRALWWDVRDQEVWRWVFEWVCFWGVGTGFGLEVGGLFCEGGTVA